VGRNTKPKKRKGKIMAQFNLEDYETVEQRIRRFLDDWPDARIVTYELTDKKDREKGYWVVRAQVFLDHDDQHANCPKASGMAFEIEGTAGANKTASLENAETSAIGRALANAGYSGNKRASREEMEKVARGPVPTKPEPVVSEEFLVRIDAAVSVEELKALWDQAVAEGFSNQVSKLIQKRKKDVEK
jgi:hypothetical protein